MTISSEFAALRELGIITDPGQARVLADYLLTLDIATKLVANRDGRFAVWVQREDRVEQAREVYAAYLQNPDDPRYEAAGRSAREIRKRAEEIEKQHARQSRRLIDRWDGPLYRRAPLTYALLVVCIAAFVGDKLLGGRIYFWLAFSLTGMLPSGSMIDTGFALIQQGQVWRLLTPIFMHFGGFHIIFNMLALAAFGQRVELAKGSTRFLVFVVLTGVASNVGQFYETGGGFGGMSGVLFALASYCWMKGQIAPEEGLGLSNRNAQLFFAWFLLGVFAPRLYPEGQTLFFHMANTAHGVGLVAGLALALLRF